MAKQNRPKHSEEVKAQCMAALLKGQGVADVSRTFNVPMQTLCRWRDNAGKTTETAKYNDRVAKLIETYLETSLKTLIAQLDGFSDRAWLREQDASQLGVLHGICFDKAIRILEAVERAGQRRDEESNVVEFEARGASAP